MFTNIDISYFGDKYVAHDYAKLYVGGIQVYRPLRDLRLFNVTNDQNIMYILKLASQKEPFDKLYEKITYHTFIQSVK